MLLKTLRVYKLTKYVKTQYIAVIFHPTCRTLAATKEARPAA